MVSLLHDGRLEPRPDADNARSRRRAQGLEPRGSRTAWPSARISPGRATLWTDSGCVSVAVEGVGRSLLYHRPDVRTDRAARRTPSDQRPASGGTLGLDRRVRAGRVAPRDRRTGRRRPFHGAPDLQGHDRLPDDACHQRGDRGGRRLVQRRDRPRIDRLLGPRPAARDRPGDGCRRASSSSGRGSTTPTSRASARSSSRRSARTSTTRRSTARSCSRRRCSATDRWVARSAARRRTSRRCRRTPSTTSGGRPTGRRTRSSRSSATCRTTRRRG